MTFASSQGGAGDGTSLQKVNNSWRGAAPTPGLASQDASSTSTNTSSSVSGSTVPVPPKKKEIEVPRIITNIIAPTSTSAGIEFPVSSKTDGYSKEDLTSGRFAWNFGDGTTKDIYVSTPFTHQYKYPGQYVITLTYYRYYKNTNADATDRFTIMVLPAELTIASVGPTSDPYVELENKSSVEINISKWYIKTSSKIFFIPEGTIILPHQKLRFSSVYTFFTMSDLDSLTLFTPQGVMFDTFPKEINSTRGSHTERRPASVSPVKYSVGNQVQTSPSTVIDLNTLSGQAAGATKDVPQNMLLWMALIGVIILGGLSTFLLKQPQKENDIPDNKIQASDIDIV